MPISEIQDQAALWLAREDRGLTAQESRALAEWLQQSAAHQVGYLRLQAAWERGDRLSALHRPSMRPVRQKRAAFRPWIFALAGVALLVAGGGYYAFVSSHVAQAYATAIGGTQSVRLADGTQVQLNSNTRLRTDISTRSRTVTLESGEAYFEVVHDSKRPFVVLAGTKRITDLGTKFSVYRKGEDVRVLVREGRVQVEDIAASSTAFIVADGGHVVMTRGSESLVSAKPDRDIAEDLSWRAGDLIFNQRTLADAAEEFNRYNVKRLVIEGSARDMRIGGRFKANNVDSFIVLLHRGFGLSVDDRDNTVVISR